jgi:hypothetical protein
MVDTTDWMQGWGNVVQAVLSFLTLVATGLIGVVGLKISRNQLRPFLHVQTDWGRKEVVVLLRNGGMGPGKINRIEYKLKEELDWWQGGFLLGGRNVAADLRVQQQQQSNRAPPPVTAQEQNMEAWQRLKLYTDSSKACWQACRTAGTVIEAGEGGKAGLL